MIIAMNSEDNEPFGNNDGFDPDSWLSLGPGPEPDAERESEPGIFYNAQPVPRGSKLRGELYRILMLASELLCLVFGSGPNDTSGQRRIIELQDKLSDHLIVLRRYAVELRTEMAQHRSNLNRIRADLERLNLGETREHYFEALRQQQKQYYEAVWDLDAVRWAISKVQEALSSSRIDSVPANDHYASDLPHDSGGLGDELDGLLS